MDVNENNRIGKNKLKHKSMIRNEFVSSSFPYWINECKNHLGVQELEQKRVQIEKLNTKSMCFHVVWHFVRRSFYFRFLFTLFSSSVGGRKTYWDSGAGVGSVCRVLMLYFPIFSLFKI